jgi:hypothetical protein
MHPITKRHAVCRAARVVRDDPAMASGLAAIVLAVSVIAGIFLSYADRHELANDLGRLMAFPATRHMPADL